MHANSVKSTPETPSPTLPTGGRETDTFKPPPRPSPQGGGRLTHSNPLPDPPREIGCTPSPTLPTMGRETDTFRSPPRPSPQGGGKLSPQGEGNCPRKGEGVTRRRRSRGRVRATAYRRGGARCTRPWDFPAPRPRRPARRCEI